MVQSMIDWCSLKTLVPQGLKSEGVQLLLARLKAPGVPELISEGEHEVADLEGVLALRRESAKRSGIECPGVDELLHELRRVERPSKVAVYHFGDLDHVYSVYSVKGSVIGAVLLPRLAHDGALTS